MNDLALYIHFPYCQSKCPYCDFNSHVAESIPQESICQGYITELDYFTSYLQSKEIRSVYFGGGTPSLMSPKTANTILNHLSSLTSISDDCEITLEANPNSVEIQKLKSLQQAGINRISLGVQSFIPNDLQFLGRNHSVDEAKLAISHAQSLFDRVSFDLIYSLPNQSLHAWQSQLEEALSFQTDHLSLYQLTIEKGTPFYQQFQQKQWCLPTEPLAIAMYEYTIDRMTQAGYTAYEISNFATTGSESRHNLQYWQYKPYLGIGPGAHSRIEDPESGFYQSLIMQHHPNKWLQTLATNPIAIQQQQWLDKKTMLDETLLMGLRLQNGIPISQIETMFQHNFYDIFSSHILTSLIEESLIHSSSTHLVVTSKGRLVIPSIVEFLSHTIDF